MVRSVWPVIQRILYAEVLLLVIQRILYAEVCIYIAGHTEDS